MINIASRDIVYCYETLWTLTIFILFYFIFIFLLDNEEAHDTTVT